MFIRNLLLGLGLFIIIVPAILSARFSDDKTQPVIPTITISPTPTDIPTPIYVPTQTYQPPVNTNTQSSNYQNYGWYMHDGKSMQYINGQWYDIPQQAKPRPQQQPQQQTNNSVSSNATNIEWCRNMEYSAAITCINACNFGYQVDYNNCNSPYGNIPNGLQACLDETLQKSKDCQNTCLDRQKSGDSSCH